MRQASLLFLIASGLTLVVIGGGLDLSIGANLTLSACLAAATIKTTGQPMAGVAVALVSGTLIGYGNGLLINKLKVPAFLATFGMLWVAQGIAYWFMAGEVIYGFPPSFRFFGSGFLLGVPVPIWIMLAVGVLGVVFMSRTTIGREVYIMGANESAAHLSGIPVGRRRTLLYTLSGLMAGLTALVFLARVNAAEPGIGEPLLLPAVAAVLVGGTSLVRRQRQRARHHPRCDHPDADRQRPEPAECQRVMAPVRHGRNRDAGRSRRRFGEPSP